MPANLAEYFITDENRCTYEDVDHVPFSFEDPTPRHIFNMFTGFKSKRVPYKKEDNEWFWKHLLEVCCSNNEEQYYWKKKFIAQMAQMPCYLPRVIVVIRGNQQSGKGSLIRMLAALFGEKYVFSTQKMDDIFGGFCSGLKDTMVLQFNEISGGDGTKHYNNLKHISTCEFHNINAKYEKPYSQRNYLRIFIFSNSLTPLPVDGDDCRTLIIKIHYSKIGEVAYWDNYYKQLANQDVMNSLYSELLDEDITDYVAKTLPKSVESDFVKENCVDYVFRFLNTKLECFDSMFSMIESGQDKGKYFVMPSDLQEMFENYMCETENGEALDKMREKKGNYKNDFKKKVCDCSGIEFKAKKIKGDTRRGYVIDAEELSNYFKKTLFKNVEEDEEIEEITIQSGNETFQME